MPTRALLFTVLLTAPLAARADDLMVLLEQRKCRQCQLADVDLVHANLRDADLGNAKLMRANLSQAQLDGANLSGADLSFTSLRGASLRGANLTVSRLYGTDLREADLGGAQLSPKALEEAHWQRAKDQANHQPHSRQPRTMKQPLKAGKEQVQLPDNRSQRSDQRSTHQRLPVAAAHHHGTRLRANQQRVAANDPSVPNNTPSPCCSPASTLA